MLFYMYVHRDIYFYCCCTKSEIWHNIKMKHIVKVRNLFYGLKNSKICLEILMFIVEPDDE